MKSRIPAEVAKVRRDVSGYAFHFVRRESTPASTLGKILSDRCIEGRTYGFAVTPAVCFTDAPLAEVVRQNGVLEAYDYMRLSLWGVGFKKEALYALGGRPVIYQAPAEIALLESSIRWRHVDFDPAKVDYTWQREWRVPVPKLTFERVGPGIPLVFHSQDLFRHGCAFRD